MHMKCIFLTYPRTSINGFIWWNNNNINIFFCYFPLKSRIIPHYTSLWTLVPQNKNTRQKTTAFFFSVLCSLSHHANNTVSDHN